MVEAGLVDPDLDLAVGDDREAGFMDVVKVLWVEPDFVGVSKGFWVV